MSVRTKRLFSRLVLFGQIIVFTIFYMWGAQGIQAIYAMRHENVEINKNIAALKNEIAQLEQDINQWSEYSFYKEKIAREQLQMARSDEEIFLIH
jgi:cell division protein FtsB